MRPGRRLASPDGTMSLASSVAERGQTIVHELMTQPYPRHPHPLYHELRAISPVFESDQGMWVLTSYDACALAEGR
jgi:hypothetical protein